MEETARRKEKIALRGAFQYALLWGMSTAILVFLRFGLGEFFAAIKDTAVYRVSVGAFFLFMLGAILLYAHFLTEGKGRAPAKGKKAKKRKEARA